MTDALRSGHGIAHSRVLVVRTPDSPLLCTGKVGRGVRKKGIRTSKVPFSPCGDWGGCLQGRVVGEAPVCHLPFQASGRPNSPFSPCGRRSAGGGLQERVFEKHLRAIFCFRRQGAQTPPFPLVGEGGWGEEGQTRLEMQNSTNRLVTPRECAFRRRSAHRRQAGRAQSRVALSSRCSDPAAPVAAPYRSMQRPYRE